MACAPARAGAERVRFVRVPELPGLELMLVENSDRLVRVFHESYDICIVPLAGNASDACAFWRYRRRQEVAPRGSVMLTEPGETHVTLRILKPATYWVAEFHPRLLAAAAAELGLKPSPHLRVCQARDPLLIRCYEALRQACVAGATPLERQTRLAACLEVLLERYGEERSRRLAAAAPAQVRKARDYIVEHYDQGVTLDELVAVAGLSRYHLLRSFARHYGAPPHRYQTLVRVERARGLLRAGWPPASVEVGFADQSHLTRHFKSVMGVTPAAYQRQVGTTRGSNFVQDRPGAPMA